MKLKPTLIILAALLLLGIGVAMLAPANVAPSAEANTPAIFTAPTAPYVTVPAPVYQPTPKAVETVSPFATAPVFPCTLSLVENVDETGYQSVIECNQAQIVVHTTFVDGKQWSQSSGAFLQNIDNHVVDLLAASHQVCLIVQIGSQQDHTCIDIGK